MIDKLVQEELELLSKDLYLESPSVWIDFVGKVNDNVFDELVLFFACKYNYLSIVKFSIENNLINLNFPSRNKEFKDIYSHLLNTAKNNSSKDIIDFLVSIKDNDSKKSKPKENKSKKNNSSYIPSFECKNCKANIFEEGYIISEEKVIKLIGDKLIEESESTLDYTKCNRCKSKLDLSPSDINIISKINHCSNCLSDLTEVGILDKKTMKYNENTKSFDTVDTRYVCTKCESTINEKQKEYFKLK